MTDTDDITPTIAATDEQQQPSPPATPPEAEPPAPLATEQLPLTEFTASDVDAFAVFATESHTTPATINATPPPARLITTLHQYLTANVPPALRDEAYRVISEAVTAGQVTGFMHRDTADMEVVDANGKPTTRQYRHVLIKSMPGLAAQLEALCVTAAREDLIRTGGRHVTAEQIIEIIEHGDPTLLDAMSVAEQQRQAARAQRSAYERERRRKAKRRVTS